MCGMTSRGRAIHPRRRPWYSLDYTYAMEPGEAILQRPPIK
jgi:hypothetical protein